jgi:G:T-mismatch repair DNA endonuclease (very short patch repair protein)
MKVQNTKLNTERQKNFKKRMYKAGFKQTIVWVERKETKQTKKLSFSEFVKKLKKLTTGIDEEKLDRLLKTFLKIAKAVKEVEKIRIRHK